MELHGLLTGIGAIMASNPEPRAESVPDVLKKKLAIIGLGYVGLPLAVEFGKYQPVVGFDIDQMRIAQLEKGVDRTREVDADDMSRAEKLSYSSDIAAIADAEVYIVTVPTPIDEC